MLKSFISLFVLALLGTGTAEGGINILVHEGTRYIRLEQLAEFYGGNLVPSPSMDRLTLNNRVIELVFRPDSREITVGGVMVWLHEPVQRIRGSWTIREKDALSIVDPLIRPAEYLRDAGWRVVMLDAGHGGKDSGTRGSRSEEKRIALDLARRVRNHLLAAGFKVYMTRQSDQFIELEERALKAKRAGADFFVSIHLNAAGNSLAEGAETFALTAEGLSSTTGGNSSGSAPGNKHDAENTALAFQIQRALAAGSGPIDRGLKRARFIVLRNAPCPAALVECGFLSHDAEETRLLDENYREKMALRLAEGIRNYGNLVRRVRREAPP